MIVVIAIIIPSFHFNDFVVVLSVGVSLVAVIIVCNKLSLIALKIFVSGVGKL